jgi:GIY-YIG catalytic domain
MSLKEIYEGVVYKIINIKTNKVYIGSCIYGLNKRKITHLHNLRNNKHHSKKLQNSFNKYGEDSFIFEVIESCIKENIIQREQYWIDYFNSYNKGYNSTPKAGNCEGRPVKEETRLKISRSLQGRKVIRTNEHNKKLGISKQKKVLLVSDSGEILKEFESTQLAAKYLKVVQSTISANCSGDQKSRKFNVKFKQDV